MNSPFITSNEIKTWIGDSVTLATDIDRLILRASELIYRKTRHLTNTADTTEETAIKSATCAQIEYWMEIDETTDITGPLGAMKISDFEFNSKFGKLAPRAKEILVDAGLLYKGVNGAGRYSIEGKDVT
ncbi:MAG TPA: hypothetical protein DDW65_21635 [Firmicutes bacterium]|jgi:hypothetical protein|nr:hypothetical protein [Bacillota bacterium]